MTLSVGDETAPLPLDVGDDTEPIVLDTTRMAVRARGTRPPVIMPLPEPVPAPTPRPSWAEGVVMRRKAPVKKL